MTAAPTLAAVRHRGRTDVIVVGTGAAGLAATLGLTEAGHAVTLVTKGELGDGSTAWAQGGLAAVIDPADRVRAHVQDTLEAGAGLCSPSAVTALAGAAPQAIRWLTGIGARFDMAADGTPALGLEGGHSARRIVHAGGDASGAEVARVLAAAVARHVARGTVALTTGTVAVDALRDPDGVVCGLRTLADDGSVTETEARAVVLATGGIGRAWPVSSNPATATGDGLALALRAGALVRDVEFVQFHPTVLVPAAAHRHPGDRGALISEALRGEGARLLDLDGTPIMAGEHPLGDLAPRDVVAAAIHRRMLVSGAPHVLLDATGLPAAAWAAHFPTILELCRARGVDPRVVPIPVAPAAHYACGGVLADLDGVTSVPGLYAIGEVASTGVQGANRLASNSLTEAVIAGRRLAQRLGSGLPERREPVAEDAPRLLEAALRTRVSAATGRGAGVLRDADRLCAQLDVLAGLTGERPGSHHREAGIADVEATNLHLVSTAVATAALTRTESRGAHRRADFPEPRAVWCRHQLLELDHVGELRPPASAGPARVPAGAAA